MNIIQNILFETKAKCILFIDFFYDMLIMFVYQIKIQCTPVMKTGSNINWNFV